MKTVKRTAIILFILFSCVGCDQVTKSMARQSLSGIGRISFFNDTFRLQYAENPGAFLSLGARIPENLRFWVFTLLVAAFLVGFSIYLIRSKRIDILQTVALALIVGGGFGNLIDRVFNEGRVVDFLNLGIGALRTGIFNVADIAITFGVAWLLILSVTKREHSETVS